MEVAHDMSTSREVRASRERVWAVMADGWTYTQWVVGNSRTRAVDPTWPRANAAIRHSVGIWPIVIDDETVVESCAPLHELVLHAGLGPLGAMRITLRLQDAPEGCRVEMIEVGANGLLSLLPEKLVLLSVAPRNRECLWRLGAMAEQLAPQEISKRGK